MANLKGKLEYKPKRQPIVFVQPELLLHGNIPKPLHGLNPRTILGKDWWDIQRQRAYKKNNYYCWACGVHRGDAKYHRWLEAHEIYDINWEIGRSIYKGCCALCHSCHNYIHSGRLTALMQQGEITKRKYDDILRHGKRVTKNLKPLIYPKNICQDWSRWHLVIDGTKHYSLFKSLSDWSSYYG